MGNLSNLYISQSYQSLIHLGTNNTASANLIELQDGLGNSIGVAVNTSGDLFLSGSLTASLQQGYVLVGNASGRTTTVATSSFIDTFISGNLVTTASFNSYTQSTNIRLANLESTSASVNVSISNLNSTTQSLNTSISNLNTTTASLNTSVTNLNASSASQQVSINALNTFTASQSTASLVTSIDNLNQFSASALTSISNLNTNSASVNTSVTNINQATASLFTSASLGLTTASFSGNTLTFTKGNGTTFGIVIPDVSGSSGNFVTTSSFNSYTQSNDQRVSSLETNSASVNISISNINTFTQSANISINALNAATSSYATSAITASSLITASVSLNTITFTKGDGTTFPITVNTGSGGGGGSTDTGSLLVTASVSVTPNTITFTKGDASTFDVTLNITASASASFDTGSFATTGSNTFRGTQTIATGNLVMGNGFTISAPSGAITNLSSAGTIQFITEPPAGPGGTNDIKFINRVSGSSIIFENTQGGVGNRIDLTGGELRLTAAPASGSNGNISLSTTTEINLRGAIKIKSKEDNNSVTVLNSSGSLILSANNFTTASLHLLQSNPGNTVNLVFKNNNTTGSTIISGSNNIFTNPNTPTTGYIRYIGGSNNLYLNNSNGINSQITQSAASVSGNRPTMDNNIFNGSAAFTINQARNPGTHTYSQNIIGGTGTTTINALAFTGSLNLTQNYSNGTITINAASASVAEIATGISGSGTVTVGGNGIFGGTMTITSPRTLLPANTQTVSNNILLGGLGGNLSMTNISSSLPVNASSNTVLGSIGYTNAGAAGLALHASSANISGNYGALGLFASASAITAFFNISPNTITVTNRMYSGSLGSGSLTFNNNNNQGASNTYTISGSFGGTGTGVSMLGNGIFGSNNTIFTNVEGRGMYVDFRSNTVGGHNLILTGSNNNAITASGGGYFGRFNADDGLRNTTGENIFVVGTGTSASNRKTGFLIDSGSNTYVEGTLNVSGSTSLTGSLYIKSGSWIPSATGSSLLTWNSTTGQIGQSSVATLISSSFSVGAFNSTVTQSGSAAVSQSMTFNNTDIANGITLNGGGTQLTIGNNGTYNIQFSAQIIAPTGADTIWIWLKKNGTNVSNTATKLVLRNNEADVAAWNFVVPAIPTDYFELVWQSLDGHAQLLTEAAAGNYPAIPSVIVTVTQVE